MFLPIKKHGHGKGPESMTAPEIAEAVLDVVVDTDFVKLAEMQDPLEKKVYLKAQDMAERLIRRQANFKNMNKDVLVGFRAGVAYGVGMSAKMTQSASEVDFESGKGLRELSKKFLYIFKALDEAVVNYEDSKWFENLMKNAVVAEPKKVVKKKPKTKK